MSLLPDSLVAYTADFSVGMHFVTPPPSFLKGERKLMETRPRKAESAKVTSQAAVTLDAVRERMLTRLRHHQVESRKKQRTATLLSARGACSRTSASYSHDGCDCTAVREEVDASCEASHSSLVTERCEEDDDAVIRRFMREVGFELGLDVDCPANFSDGLLAIEEEIIHEQRWYRWQQEQNTMTGGTVDVEEGPVEPDWEQYYESLNTHR